MPNFINEVGNRHGKLVVIKEAGRDKVGRVLWECKCDCGNIAIIRGDSLRYGATQSCGCLKRLYKRRNEIGNRYGRVVVTKEAGRNRHGQILWEYSCDCGNIGIALGGNLRTGYTKSCGCAHAITEEPGTRYGKLVVIGRSKNKEDGNGLWECLCDCGKMVIVPGGRLRSGSKKSCGCLRTKPKGEAAFNIVLNAMKMGAKVRGYDWDLTREQVLKITKQNCFYCGTPPSNIAAPKNTNGDYVYSGIDRIDNNKGYIIDNIIPCCWICNRAKATMTISEFLEWIERISTHERKLAR